MNYRLLALDHASKGYYVFPVGKEKIPFKELKDWEGQATNDPAIIHAWWDEHPGAYPAVAPGRSGLAVIDLDRHPGEPSGFESLKKLCTVLGETFYGSPVLGKSVSGMGMHMWYPADIGSANGIYPGIDRKSSGGYVVATYKLPEVSVHTTPFPEAFTVRGGAGTSSERREMTDQELDLWMITVGDGPVSARIQKVVDAFQGKGNEQMSRSLARVAALASAGHTGAFHAINKMLGIWLGGSHSSGDPEREFHASLRSAIERFGHPPDDDDALHARWLELTSDDDTYELNETNLRQALSIFMERVAPKKVDKNTAKKVNEAFRRSMKALPLVTSKAREDKWMDVSQRSIKKALGETHV